MIVVGTVVICTPAVVVGGSADKIHRRHCSLFQTAKRRTVVGLNLIRLMAAIFNGRFGVSSIEVLF